MAGRADGLRGCLGVAVRPMPAEESLVLTLAGELDHDSAQPLRGADLRFCDSTGPNALLRGRLAAREARTRLDLAALRPPVARMFHITGAGAVFHVHGSVDEALADRPRKYT